MSKKKTICFYAMTAILFALIFIVAVFLRVKTFEYHPAYPDCRFNLSETITTNSTALANLFNLHRFVLHCLSNNRFDSAKSKGFIVWQSY